MTDFFLAKHQRQQRDFFLLVKAAIAGERCPKTYPEGPIAQGSISDLWSAGYIRSEVSGHNYRTVIILKGEHAGKRTAPEPHGFPPYLINGVRVDRMHRRPT